MLAALLTVCQAAAVFHPVTAWAENRGPSRRDDSQALDQVRRLREQAQSLISQGDYAGAAALWEQIAAIAIRDFGSNHPNVAISLANLAFAHGEMGQYDKATTLYRRSLAIYDKIPDTPQLRLVEILNNLGFAYKAKGIHGEAERAYRRSLAILGLGHPDSADALHGLASLFIDQRKYAQAEPLLQSALAIRERTLGPSHPLVATALNDLGVLYQSQDEHAKSEPLHRRSLAIREKILGPEHLDVASSLFNLAGACRDQGLCDKADFYYQRSLEIREKRLGSNHPLVADSLGGLARVYEIQGKYKLAESAQRRALLIREQNYGLGSIETASDLNTLALIHKRQGRFDLAESAYQRSLKIREKALGENHPDVSDSLSNLAALYKSQGRYDRAVDAIVRSVSILRKTSNAELGNSVLAVALSNVANLYQAIGQPGNAEPLYRRALAVLNKPESQDHPHTPFVLIGLADLLRDRGQSVDAKSLYLDSIRRWSKLYGPSSHNIGYAVSKLAYIYLSEGRYAASEALYRRSLAILKDALGPGHPDVAAILDGLSLAYLQKGDVQKGLSLLEESSNLRFSWLRNQLPFLPARERPALLAQHSGTWELPLSVIPREHSAAELALRSRLNRAGLLQEIEQRQALFLRTSGTIKEQVQQLRALMQQLATVSLPPERRDALRQERDQLQAALYRQLPDLQLQSASVQDVTKALPADGALVEFQRFHPFDGKQPQGKRLGAARYLALILRPNGMITPVQLGLAQPIDTVILQALQASASNTSDAPALWNKVSQLVLQPLQPHLAGTRQWFLSPDGELNRVPFAAIPSPQQPAVPLAQAVQLRQLTTGRDLLRLQRPAKAGEKPLVMANPSYDRAQAQAPVIAAATASTAERPQQRSSGIDSTRWAPLPATQLEGQQVAALLGTQAITGSQATALALQQRQGPRVLHIATHGFFAPDQDTPPSDPLRAVQDSSRQLRGFQGEDPQLRSGLVLAGANQPDADPNDDGYLTAAEATGLQLDGTELVTLSACSTAQGAIKTGEGVYGLQRSLTVAGARSTLLSLWKVDDAATAEFMQRFYKRLKAGEGRADALQAVQQEFRSDPALKARGWDSIFYWGAWQLVGDWRPIQGL